MKKRIYVLKASGDTQLFKMSKLKTSLKNAGAEKKVIQEIVHEIEQLLFPGITTKKIYDTAFALLKDKAFPIAGRYKLKNAIRDLGPSGFPFEEYVGSVLKKNGYQARVGVIIQGHCIQHEVDVEAEKDNVHIMIECKFHAQAGSKSNVKVSLYIHSRFRDIETMWKKSPEHAKKEHQGWVVTNSQFSDDALTYGECSGLKMISWAHPKNNSLKKMIEDAGLHPITCLNSISDIEMQKLLDKKIVLCSDICEDKKILLSIGIKEDRIQGIQKEGRAICKTAFKKLR